MKNEKNLYYRYLLVMLGLGFTDYVYAKCQRWFGKGFPLNRYYAARMIGIILVADFDFYRCPSCERVTETHDEHIKTGEGHCYDTHLALLDPHSAVSEMAAWPATDRL